MKMGKKPLHAKCRLCAAYFNIIMKERIRTILEDALPLADLDSDFLFAELSSLDITTIMMLLSEEYHITLDSHDVTPKNFMTLDSIVALVQSKMEA